MKKSKKKSKNWRPESMNFTMNILVLFLLLITHVGLLNEMFGNRNTPIELRGTLDRGGGTLDGHGALRSHTYYFSTIEHPETNFTIIENYTAELNLKAYTEAMRSKQAVVFTVLPNKSVSIDQAGVFDLSNNSYLVLGMKTSTGQVILDLQETQNVRERAWWRDLVLMIVLTPLSIMISLRLFQKDYRTKKLGQILASYVPKRSSRE